MLKYTGFEMVMPRDMSRPRETNETDQAATHVTKGNPIWLETSLRQPASNILSLSLSLLSTAGQLDHRQESFLRLSYRHFYRLSPELLRLFLFPLPRLQAGLKRINQ